MFGNMSAIGKIGAATTLVTLAGQLIAKKGPLWDVIQGLSDTSAADKGHQLWDMIKRADHTGNTLAQYTQQLRVVTRVFIDTGVIEEPVLDNLLRALRGWYVAQNLATIQLNQLVTAGTSVQDILGVVQTGENPHYQNAGINAFRRFAGLTSLYAYGDGMSSEAIGIVGGGSATPISSLPDFSKLSGVKPDASTMAFVKQVQQAIHAASSSKNQSATANAANAVYQAAMKAPDGRNTVTKAWQYFAGVLNSDLPPKGKMGGAMAGVAAAAVSGAALALSKDAVMRMARPILEKISPDEAKTLERDVNMARDKEELVGMATKYHVMREEDAKKLDEYWAPVNIDAQRVDLEKLNGLAVGELYNIQLRDPNHPKASVTVPLMIQMTPIGVPFRVAPRFIDGLVSPSLWQRWTMMTAGEIEFFRDFIGQRDRLKQKISHTDSESIQALKTFLSTIHKKDNYSLADVASNRSTGSMSQNLANSVMVFSEDTVRQAYADSGINLHNDDDRKRYFASTYTMIIAVLDPAFGDVSVYINGIDGKMTFKYSAFKPNDKKFDPVDLVAAMQALGSGKTPTIR